MLTISKPERRARAPAPDHNDQQPHGQCHVITDPREGDNDGEAMSARREL
jgi:hypothetical protein